jgi:hypothetical protein
MGVMNASSNLIPGVGPIIGGLATAANIASSGYNMLNPAKEDRWVNPEIVDYVDLGDGKYALRMKDNLNRGSYTGIIYDKNDNKMYYAGDYRDSTWDAIKNKGQYERKEGNPAYVDAWVNPDSMEPESITVTHDWTDAVKTDHPLDVNEFYYMNFPALQKEIYNKVLQPEFKPDGMARVTFTRGKDNSEQWSGNTDGSLFYADDGTVQGWIDVDGNIKSFDYRHEKVRKGEPNHYRTLKEAGAYNIEKPASNAPQQSQQAAGQQDASYTASQGGGGNTDLGYLLTA